MSSSPQTPGPASQQSARREPSSPASPQSSNEKLQIRVVPYSPPRLSSDGSAAASSRPNSYAGASPLASSSSHQPIDEQGGGSGIGGGRHGSGSGGPDQDSLAGPGVSASRRPLSSLTATSAALGSEPDYDESNLSSRASSPRPPSSRRAKRVITINSDKTFSLIPQSETSASRAGSFGSHQLSSTTPSSSWGRVSSNVFLFDERSSSPLGPVAGRRSLSSSPSSPGMVAHDSSPILSTPRNFRMKGGMRRVDKTPESRRDASGSASSSQDPSLPPLPETIPSGEPSIPQLNTKDSFQSSDSGSTLSDRTNYKIYGQSSPLIAAASRYTAPSVGGSRPASSNNSNVNYQILGESSSEAQSVSDFARPRTGESDANYILHGPPSASGASVISQNSRLRSEYSQESLVVAPLRPVKTRSYDFSGVAKSRSRDSLRRGSLSSLTNVLNQDATRNLFTNQPTMYRTLSLGESSGGPSPGTAEPSQAHPLRSHPHQWSAPLSTVMSESEDGSLPPSRSLSPFSSADRRSSGFLSHHTRHMLSISSMAAVNEDMAGPSRVGSGALEQPPATLYPSHSRNNSNNMRLIRHHDENGDGLADLGQSPFSPSRARLASFISSSSSERGLRSSASTRSLNAAFSLPTWARLYYGSGERRFLIAQASSDSIRSLYNASLYNDTPTRHYPVLNRSPSAERFAGTVYNPRRRPREEDQANDSIPPSPTTGRAHLSPHAYRIASAGATSEIQPVPASYVQRGMKKRTSSIWSPHLRQDRRASRYSIWEPPSIVWSTDGDFDWRRNMQIVLFVIGFVFPFAWMIAAFLPLPPKPQLEMIDHHSTSNLDFRQDPSQVLQILNEMRYNNARWWRNLNRIMAMVGVLIIGAVIALAVVGTKQRWGS